MTTPVYDIESIQWVNPIAVGYYIDERYHEVLKTSDDHDVMWSFLQEVRKYENAKFYAHNAANYDNKFVLDCLARHDEEVRFIAGLGKIVWVKPNISFEDSFLLLGRNLATCCEAFNVPRKLTWEHDTTVNPWEMGPRLDTFRQYLRRDCISLSESLDKFIDLLLSNFGILPSSTLALTAAKSFDKGFFPLKKIASNEAYEFAIRDATYGGRNEVYKRYGESIYLYDVKRMFMSCYDTPVPIGKMSWITPNIDRGTLAEAMVKVPDTQVGPLPYRYMGRLIFPVGIFRGWWDMVELRNAVRKGVDIKLLRQLEGEEEPILKPFSDLVNQLSNGSNQALGSIWKLFGLRLSGKFGQHKSRTEIKHVRDTAANEYNPIDQGEVYHEVDSILNTHQSPYTKPAINMRIRAEARVRHLNKLLEAKDIYYCDTDSVYTTSEMSTGDNIGELKQIGYAKRAYFVGNKFYGYVDDNNQLKQKTAGYRDYQLTEYDFRRVLKGEEIACSFKRIGDWKSVVHGDGVNLVNRKFTFRQSDFGNRIMGDAETSPIKLNEA